MLNSQDQEQLLLEISDEYGRIQIIESGAYRFLEFGDGAEQSCVFMPDPAWLEYDYTRAMLLGGLVHPQPETALFLGMGAGTLIQSCLQLLPLEDVEVIEIRQSVIELARDWLKFPLDDERLTLRIGDALNLLPSAETADLIFVDLYTEKGPASEHLAWKFLEDCQSKLNPDGWLIINQWGTDAGPPLGAALLRGLFHRHYWECPVSEGNVILIIPASLEQHLDIKLLKQRSAALEKCLGYSLDSLINVIRVAS